MDKQSFQVNRFSEVDKEKKQADVPQDVDNDYKYARENLYVIIEKVLMH